MRNEVQSLHSWEQKRTAAFLVRRCFSTDYLSVTQVKSHPCYTYPFRYCQSQYSFTFLLHCSFLLSLICYYDTHIIDNSYVVLCYFLYPTTLYPYNSLGVASMFLLSLSAICSLYHRYLSGHLPNIYRTNTGQIPDIYRTRIEGTPLHYPCYIGATYWLYWRCSLD